jgi:enoyl-CoA hydratase/carnithine racemase
MFLAAEKIYARDAVNIGLVETVAEDPVAEALQRIRNTRKPVADSNQRASLMQP